MKESINPFTGEKVYSFKKLSDSQLWKKIEASHEAFLSWKKTGFNQRAELMSKAADQLRSNKNAYAKIMTVEMGKPISQSVAEVEKCAWVCEYYAEHAERQLGDEVIETDADRSFVSYEPLGIILAVMPWNYPLWQVFRFAAPNLMAGNVGILKHASNVLKCGELIEEIFTEAGFPEGCFQHLIVDSEKVESILSNERVKAVTLTGSNPAGASGASIAGKEIKKSVLELGGSNALVIFKDADLEPTLDTCVKARFQNTGQSCIAGKRLLVHEDIAEEFTQRYIEKVRELKSGDPMDTDTYIGVLAREDLAEDLEKQVRDSIDMGAKLEIGGKRKGTYYEPTVLSRITPEMPMFKQETFGPAIGITTFDSDDEAVRLSNDSKFGLGVSLFTADMDKARKLAPRFDEGAVFVNELVKSDPRLPFGGVKISGYGRELSAHGIKEFMNKKTVYFKR